MNINYRRITVRVILCILVLGTLVWYRAWLQMNRDPLFVPLGLSERTLSAVSAEESASNPAEWKDPIEPIVLSPAAFDRLTNGEEDVHRWDVDVLVIGDDITGNATALAAATDGARTMLAREDTTMNRLWSGRFADMLQPPPTSLQGLTERRLRTSLEQRFPSRAYGWLPNEWAETLATIINDTSNLTVLEDMTPIAFTTHEGAVDTALLRGADGHTHVVHFSFLVDGTPTGRLLALTGTPTRTAWDTREATGDTHALPGRATNALTHGYTQSGWTIPGIGERLDGGNASITIGDRGFYGSLATPLQRDPCWVPTDWKAYIRGGVVWRATTIGCNARYMLQTGFAGTYDIWVTNYRNTGIDGTVEQEQTPAIHLRQTANPDDGFLRLGTVELDPDHPATLTLTSLLPTDRIESVILTKTRAKKQGATMYDERSALAPIVGTQTSTSIWKDIVVPEEADYIVTLEKGCDRSCSFELTETGSRIILGQGSVISRASWPDDTPIAIAQLRPNMLYALTIATAGHSALQWRLERADTAHASIATGTAGTATERIQHTGMYDIWISTDTAGTVTARGPADATTVTSMPGGLRYAGAHFAAAGDDLVVTGNGAVTMLVRASTTIDDDHRMVQASASEQTIQWSDFPVGTLTMHMEGTALPTTATVRSGSIPGIQQITFVPSGVGVTATNDIVHEGGPLRMTFPATSEPFEIIVHESLPRFAERAVTGSGGTMHPLLNADETWVWSDRPLSLRSMSQSSSGILILRTDVAGIGPVTMRSLESPTLSKNLTDRAYAEYFWLKYATTDCATPACDPRKFVTVPNIHTDVDLPDGRRLASRVPLAEKDTSLSVGTCAGASCADACVTVPAKGKPCVLREQTGIDADAILSIDGTGSIANIFSPAERRDDVLHAFLERLNRDAVLRTNVQTWLKTAEKQRSVTIGIGALFANETPNILSAGRSIGTTQIASRALRSASTEMAIGDAVGHVLGFAVKQGTTLPAIADDPTLIHQLQSHLARAGVRVFPIDNLPDDPLLQSAVQSMIVNGQATLDQQWEGTHLRFVTNALAPNAADDTLLEARMFGSSGNHTVRDLLGLIAEHPAATDDQLIVESIDNGLIPTSMQSLPQAEILRQPLTRPMLLKGEFLLSLRTQ